MQQRAFVVLNPAAGRGSGRRLARPIAEAFRQRGWGVELRETTFAGEEQTMGEAAARAGWPLVVAAGGDGTVHGVANGLLRAPARKAALGVVAIGTGNDFAGLVGASRNPGRAVAALEGGRDRAFDVGLVEDEYFTNGFGVGFDTAVLEQMQRLRRLRGPLLYLAAVYRSFLRFRAPTIEVRAAEHHETGPMMLAEVSIGRTAGGGFRITPDADPTDGLLDVCMIRRVGLMTFLRYVPRVVAGTHGRLKPVRLFRTTRLRIGTPGTPLAAHMDGELRRYDGETLDVRIVPRALRVRCAS